MTTSTSRRRFTRAAALVGSATIIASVGIGWSALSASAAFPGTPYETEFEIDANTAVEDGQDWDSTPASAPNLQGAPFRTADACGNVTEDQIVPGTKIDDFLLEQPPTNTGNVNTKSDLCAVYSAWELVFVPTADPSDDPQAGQYNFILYGGWSRPLTNGEIDVLFPLLGDDPAVKTDDRIISYDFDDSDQSTEVQVLTWNGSTWVASALPAGSFEAQTTTDETSLPDPDNPGEFLTFGEFAINLTLTGILPENGPCVNFAMGDPMTRTGNSPTATLEDIVDVDPLNLTNCGSLTVTKITEPATPATPATFEYTVDQLDGAIIQSPNVTSITDTLTVPGEASHTIDDLLISPDYVVTETDLPDGWTQESLVCTSFDPITGQNVTRTLFSEGAPGPDTAFPIAPGVTAECEILNVGPPNPLDVATTATASFDRSVAWSLDKSVAPASHTGTAGANAGSSTWTVVATKTVTLGNFAVAGTVTVTNSNAIPVPFAITQSLDDGTAVNLTCPSLSVPANSSIVCTFSASPTAATATVATAVVTPSIAGLDAVTRTAAVSFLANVIGNDTVTVDDDRDSEGQFPAVISSSTTFDYGETFPCSSNPADYTNFVDTDTYPNTATLTGSNTNLSDSASVTVTCNLPQQQAPPVADIAVVKTATPTVVTPGGNVTWTLQARNNGPDPADNATIVDNLPTALTLVSFTSPAGWDCSASVTGNPGKLSCTKPTMGVNESATFTLTTTVAAAAAGTSINNTAVVSTTTSETTTSNNQDAEPITVQVVVLPPTGGGVWNRVAIASALVLAGIALLAIERRRRFMS